MKIGITTHYYRSKNYGGNLQAFALCKVLERMGHQAEQICFPFAQYTRYTPNIRTRLNIAINNLIDLVAHPIARIRFKQRCEAMLNFNRTFIPHSKNIYTDVTLPSVASEYDLFITGSDIVWGPSLHSSFFFLNFLPENAKKMSYAASLGTDMLTPKEKFFFKSDLSSYHAISVREKATVKVVEEATGKHVEYCLDPTLLLEAKDWDKICSDRIVDEPYVFCYFLGTNSGAINVAHKYAEKNNTKLVNIPYLSKLYNPISDFGDVKLSKISPCDFLSLIKHSECVFTDSFHACVFSQIYQKDFFAFRRNNEDNLSVRITDFLSMLNLKDRYCDSEEKETVEYLDTAEPLSMRVNASDLEYMKKHSLYYLEKKLSCL